MTADNNNAAAEPVTGLAVGADIVLHINHAREKHVWTEKTWFAHCDGSYFRDKLALARNYLQMEIEKYGEPSVSVVMYCELLEFFCAALDGDRSAAFHELMDLGAAGVRFLNDEAGVRNWPKTEIDYFHRRKAPRFPEDFE